MGSNPGEDKGAQAEEHLCQASSTYIDKFLVLEESKQVEFGHHTCIYESMDSTMGYDERSMWCWI